MDYFLAMLLLFYIGEASSEWTANEAVRCYEELNKDGDLTNLLIDVTTPEKVEAFCKRQSSLYKCISLNEHYLSVKENTKYQQKTSGVHKFYINVCPPGTDITKDYKDNAPCFQLIKDKILSCGSDLQDLESYKMATDRFTRCCALKSHRECLKRVAAESCGNKAAQVIENMAIKYFEPKLKGCDTVSCDSSHTTLSDRTSTAHKTDKHHVKWSRHPTQDYGHRYPETKDWRDTTVSDDWEKHKKHGNGAVTISLNVVIIVFTCLLAVLSYSSNKY